MSEELASFTITGTLSVSESITMENNTFILPDGSSAVLIMALLVDTPDGKSHVISSEKEMQPIGISLLDYDRTDVEF